MNIFDEYTELFPEDKRIHLIGFDVGCGEANDFLISILTKSLEEKKPLSDEGFHRWKKMIDEFYDYVDKHNLII